MASKIDRIASMLVSGIRPASIAQVVGVSPSYISNLLANEDFKLHLHELSEELSEESTTEVEEAKIYTDSLAAAEHTILKHLIDRLPYMADNHAIAALSTVGARRDSMHRVQTPTLGYQAAAGATIRMVEITIPAAAAPDLVIGKNNEVVSIGSRAVTPMPTASLQALMDSEVSNYENEHWNYREAIEQL